MFSKQGQGKNKQMFVVNQSSHLTHLQEGGNVLVKFARAGKALEGPRHMDYLQTYFRMNGKKHTH